MEYEVIDSSGTDDDNTQHHHTGVTLRGSVAVRGRPFVGSAPFERMQSDMEFEIHNLEQIAYGAILRAFKAQSDALTWEKEGLITELRKELRVSDDEHRELLSEVNADDLIRRIREWREAGGSRNLALMVPQLVNNQLPSPTISASRRKQKPFMSGHQVGALSQSLHHHSLTATTQPLSSAAKWGPSPGIGGRRTNAGQSGFAPAKNMQYQFVDSAASGAPVDESSDIMLDPLVGKKVMIRWPADNNFYEAVITDYSPADGRHSLVYDNNTPNETLEWVNIKEVPPEDIRWVNDEPIISWVVEAAIPNHGRERRPQIASETRPSENGVTQEDLGEIEIFHTDTLIKKVEKVLDASHPDVLELGKAKKLLKDHEQTLIEVIAKLADVCDSNEDNAQADLSV